MIVKAPWLLALKACLVGLDPKNVGATTVGPFIFVGHHELSVEELRHERIHVAQWWELLGVGYVVLFWLLWFRGLVLNRSAAVAYDLHPLEQEAYMGMWRPDYLDTRPRWGWRKFL